MDEYEKAITSRLKNEIEMCGISKSEISKKVGISKPTLSQYLSGRVFPSLPTFGILCHVIDASADEILKFPE